MWTGIPEGKMKIVTMGTQPVLSLESVLGFLVQSESRSVVSDSLWPHGLYSPWNSPGQNTGVGSLFLLRGIFPTQGSNPGLLHCRQILYQLSHKRSPESKKCWFSFWIVASGLLVTHPSTWNFQAVLVFWILWRLRGRGGFTGVAGMWFFRFL